MEDPLDGMLTIDEAQQRLRVAPRTIQRWAETGKLVHVRVGRKIFFPPQAIRDVWDGTQSKYKIFDWKTLRSRGVQADSFGRVVPIEDRLARLLTLEQAAAVFRHVPATVQRWVRQKSLHAIEIGRRQYFTPSEIRRYLTTGIRRHGFKASDRRKVTPDRSAGQ